MKGLNVRISLGQAAFILGVALAVQAAIILAFPGVSLVYSLVGVLLLELAAGGAFSLATGWAFGCTLAFPPIVLSAQLMQVMSSCI